MTFNPRGRVAKPLTPPPSTQPINSQVQHADIVPVSVQCGSLDFRLLCRNNSDKPDPFVTKLLETLLVVLTLQTQNKKSTNPKSLLHSYCSSTLWANHSRLPTMWAGTWAGWTAWQGRNQVNSSSSRRIHHRHHPWPRPRPPLPPPALQAPLLLPRDPRPRLTAHTVANLYVPGRTTASTCSSTPVRNIGALNCLLCLFPELIIFLFYFYCEWTYFYPFLVLVMFELLTTCWSVSRSSTHRHNTDDINEDIRGGRRWGIHSNYSIDF